MASVLPSLSSSGRLSLELACRITEPDGDVEGRSPLHIKLTEEDRNLLKASLAMQMNLGKFLEGSAKF